MYMKATHVVQTKGFAEAQPSQAPAVVRHKEAAQLFFISQNPACGALNVAQLVERLPGVCKALGWNGGTHL